MSKRTEKILDELAKPGGLGSGHDFRAVWHAVPHEDDPKNPADKDWADSEPDPNAP